MREINRELIAELGDLFPSASVPETYVVGTDFAEAPMFRRFGAITMIDKDAGIQGTKRVPAKEVR